MSRNFDFDKFNKGYRSLAPEGLYKMIMDGFTTLPSLPGNRLRNKKIFPNPATLFDAMSLALQFIDTVPASWASQKVYNKMNETLTNTLEKYRDPQVYRALHELESRKRALFGMGEIWETGKMPSQL